MIVGDLLELDDLHLEVAWAAPHLLGREVTGVTSTDLQDPARYLQPGELVLTGLVWWRSEDTQTALRFANGLRIAEVAALLAGEGTRGTVLPELVDACRLHGIPLLTVPAGTSFRAVTDRVYLRLWGGLQTHAEGSAALPAAARHTLGELLRTQAPLDELLRRAVADLGLPACSLRTGAGRLLAASTGDMKPCESFPVEPVPVGPPAETPYDGWLLQPHSEPGPTAAALLHGLAELFTPLAARARAAATAARQTGTRLLELLDTAADPEADRALAHSGLLAHHPLTPVAARIDNAAETWTAAALAEALHELPGSPFLAAPDPHGGAVALCAAPETAVAAALQRALPRLEARLGTGRPLRVGVGPAVPPHAAELRPALVQARYALRLRPPGAVGRSCDLTSVETLLRGVPAEVSAAYRSRLLAPLVEHDRGNAVSLLDTLDAFLLHSASWSRTAEALRIHVNTVHYRVKRIEELTGRNLLDLRDRLDLWAALRIPDQVEEFRNSLV